MRSRRSRAASWPASGPGSRSISSSSSRRLFLPDIVSYLPFHVASSALRVTVGAGGGNGGGAALIAPLDPNVALLLVTVYLVVAAAATALIVERAEITG